MTVKKTKSDLIRTHDDIARGVRALRRKCAHMREAHDQAGSPPLRRRRGGFEGLARIIVAQQLSVASASAISGRLQKTVSPFTATEFMRTDDEVIQGCGVSRPKIRTLRAVGIAVDEGVVNFRSLARKSPEEVHQVLTSLKGIGPWTADIYIMFCMGHSDGFAPGDLALQQATADLMGLGERPSVEELADIAERWRPWRGVAARLLWSYYAHARAQKNAMPT